MTAVGRAPIQEQREWLSRDQAAAYLGISIRQLNELRLPRSYLGRLPRYSKLRLNEYLFRTETTPPQKEERCRRPKAPPSYRGRRPKGGLSSDAWLADIERALTEPVRTTV